MPGTVPSALICNACLSALPNPPVNATGALLCPACGVELRATIFPALFRKPEKGQAAERILVDGEASCFYHTAKKAVSACENCGRFLCALCEIKLADRLLCPACIESGKRKEKLDPLSTRRILYDEIALALVVFPVVFFCLFPYIGWCTAPFGVFLAAKHLKTPQDKTLPRGQAKAVVAAVLGVLEFVAWVVALIWFIITLTKH